MRLKGLAGDLTVFVVPLDVEVEHYRSYADQARAVMFIGTLAHDQEISSDTLQMLYAMTPAEARLAKGLCRGLTMNELSERHGATTNTLRSQLKSVFQKTNTTRQAELVRLIMSGPAVLRT